ncbi:21122_t:CDS:2, partial [Cetraspora pellucida]
LNFLKYQTATKYAKEHKKLLPQSFIIESITFLQDQTLLVILLSNTEHNFQNLFTYYFDQSFKKFSAPVSDKSGSSIRSNQPTWTHPTLDFSIFYKDNEHPASFKILTSIKFLHELADSAEKQFIEINKTDHNINYQTYYFYEYFKAFFQAAAQNDEIFNLNYDQAIKKATTQITNIHFLARIITYFEILKQ